ncbi:dihydroxyacetone kinase subunit L [Alkalibaculum sp. M08DMB]|uniref:phosphoenolpyruvate--glycerone phosphotransferase n=1 Tax=Alkalibaculum sporogenes TaxID=2655001 RepID=A0A6A7KAY5_9FIRM|nr:dihydroxyacetone kinase subunit DhaL [Alkalibaculum sporogenes]MPW26515.1 dihydroxyacetone kinase subunit L [Alkalibaculum sporogenes]
MEYIVNARNSDIVLQIIQAIHEKSQYLSEIDGATGDGDHGVNMDKGFSLAKERIVGNDLSFSDAIKILGRTLLMDIGGSMGPIYGTIFNEIWKSLKDVEKIQDTNVLTALNNGLMALIDLAGAKPGDKTLIDTMVPAIQTFASAIESGNSFSKSLDELSRGAEEGKANTKNMMAKIGRAARLQERSIGFLDAGATSCCIILQTMASAIKGCMQSE